MNAVILFTRVPEAGTTKTRLMPYFNKYECEKLQTAMLKDIYIQCKIAGADIFISYTPEDKEDRLYQILGDKCKCFLQKGDGLGERMYNAFKYVFAKGYKSCVLIGSDIPMLTANDIKEGFRQLKYNELVFGKTADGGYYLTGMKKPVRDVFDIEAENGKKSAYGHSRVWENTFSRLKAKGFKIGYTKTLHDIDLKSDINYHISMMRSIKKLQKTNTGKYLLKKRRISVIIPVYNEGKNIRNFLNQLNTLYGKCEIIFVDGGSNDDTKDILNSCNCGRYKVLSSPKGRAFQMNEGAKASCGDILFFLHCDSELPDKVPEHIRYVMKDFEAGCFGIAFRSKNPLMLICRIISNHRIKDRKVMFGDQGIFIDRELFFKAGKFPEIPIMEDYGFSLTLKEMGIRLGIAKKRIYTSERRFPDGNYDKLRLMWKMNRLRKMYRDGIDVNIISSLYRDMR